MTTDRNAVIERQFLGGMNQSEIGKAHGLSRERVRQILDKRGVDTQAVIRHYAKLRQQEVEAHLAAHREAAERQRLANLLKPTSRPAHVGAGFATKYTDEQMLDVLREESKKLGGKQPSSQTWTRLPAAPTYVIRFGSWQRACNLAGVGTAKPVYRKNRWADEQLAGVVLEFLSDTDNAKGGGPNAYDTWRATRNGYPSAALIRQRFSGWVAARKAALKLRDER